MQMLNIKDYIKESISVKESLLSNDALLSCIEKASDIIVDSIKKGNKILIAGNGGSAADAQHMAGELVSYFYKKGRKALPAIALTTDTSVLTAIANDTQYNQVFSRQLEALGNKGDVFIAITTSGKSQNILEALDTAAKKNIHCIILTGNNIQHLHNDKNIIISVNSSDTPKIQEAHIMIEHIICFLTEKNLIK